MPSPSAPADVVRAVAAGVSLLITGNLTERERQAHLDHLAGLYAEHTDVRHPLAPTGDTPLRTRAELRRHFADASVQTHGADRFEPVGQVHETADPEVVVFEFSYVGAVNGRPFALPCVFVTRVRDGVIVESRDYADHVGMARVFGRLDHLATALAADSR
ncbi:nuclear transport factor 2 family protein [Streptomyces sp. 110]|uniref:Nuclear transport factor 2 family protein n=1 Tax=Streptomyces endocoffeicus TaxID=2898945 RepID=A0ABS1PK72_9ACTN|nr:nuclear transport factor 2 family protein [Streptomyces endocoffeicus]MBL1112560.1 nuclear transport factor 2 family protein [Streptomyces endocoffeicus]